MTIEYYTKNVYGKEVMYIRDPKIAETVFTLTGHVTISKSEIAALRALGHTLEGTDITGIKIAHE